MRETILKVSSTIAYGTFALLLGIIIGYNLDVKEKQTYYDKGIKDGKRIQLQADEYLYIKCSKVIDMFKS